MKKDESKPGRNRRVPKITGEQKSEMKKMFLAAISEMPSGMAEGLIADKKAFSAYVQIALLGKDTKRPQAYYFGTKYSRKLLDIAGWAGYLRQYPCPSCEELFSGRFEFHHKDDSCFDMLWFSEKQSIYVICDNCGEVTEFGSGAIGFRHHHSKLSLRMRRARTAFQKLAPLLDKRSPEEPRWFTEFREAVSEIRYFFTDKTVVIDGGSTAGELQDIRLGNLFVFLKGKSDVKVSTKYKQFQIFRDNLLEKTARGTS